MAMEHVRSEELYLLVGDPGEQRNVVSDRPETRDRFHELLANYLKTVHRSRDVGKRIELDETTRKQLESLGYVYN